MSPLVSLGADTRGGVTASGLARPQPSVAWQHAGQRIDTGGGEQIPSPLPFVLLLSSPSQNYMLLTPYVWADSLEGPIQQHVPYFCPQGALETNAAAVVALRPSKDEGVIPPAAFGHGGNESFSSAWVSPAYHGLR